MPKLILVMIDGLGADYMAHYQSRLPALGRLATSGLFVQRLAADVPATSLPGRTSILTGTDAARHGVYGNAIWDDDSFRYADPDDVRVPTLPQLALEAGLSVAVVGYGMVRPEHATVFQRPWWTKEMMQRPRDDAPVPAGGSWRRVAEHIDDSGRMAELAHLGLPGDLPDAYAGDRLRYFVAGSAGDHAMLTWVGALAASDDPPDLIMTEILMPDSVLHLAGYANELSHWSLAQADLLVSGLMGRLADAGRLDEYAVVVVSDHGHGPVEKAIRPESLLPDHRLSCEGGILYVAVASDRDGARIEGRLAALGVEPLPGEHLPDDVRRQVKTFVAPNGASFERLVDGEVEAVAAPRYLSTHGFRPGHSADERILIAAGPGISQSLTPAARSEGVAPTLAVLLGLDHTNFRSKPLL